MNVDFKISLRPQGGQNVKKVFSSHSIHSSPFLKKGWLEFQWEPNQNWLWASIPFTGGK